MASEDETITESTNKDEEETSTPVDCCLSKRGCKSCCCSFNNYWAVLIGASIILAYLLVGGVCFYALESPNEQQNIAEVNRQRMLARIAFERQYNQTVDFLTNSTNLTNAQAEDLLDTMFNLTASFVEASQTIPAEINPIWDYAASVFFASTVITTIGYGTIAPATQGGQILFIFYALFGIPLALIFLNAIGTILSAWLDAALSPLTKRCKNQMAIKAIESGFVVALTLIFFIFIPAVIFAVIERPNEWTYLNSVYYCFVTLTTVGFGDFVPGIAGSSISGNRNLIGLYRIITAVWMWIGLALIATLISEAQGLIQAIAKACRQRRMWKKLKNKMKDKKDQIPDEGEELTGVSNSEAPTKSPDQRDTIVEDM